MVLGKQHFSASRRVGSVPARQKHRPTTTAVSTIRMSSSNVSKVVIVPLRSASVLSEDCVAVL